MSLAVHAVTIATGRVGARADILAHLRWSHQFTLALAEGQAVPRWLGLANGGLGEPTFVALHPGYYYVLAALQALGAGLWQAIQIAACAATFLVGIATCWVLRPFLTSRRAIFGAATMQTLPFMVFLFGLYEALPWHFDFPLVVLAIGLSLRHASHARWFDARLAIVIAVLTLVHLMVSFMVLMCLGAMQLGQWLQRRGWRNTWHDPGVGWGLSVALGLGLSAYYWLLAGTAQSLFRHWMDVEGMFRTSFVMPFVTSFVYGMRWPAIQWILPLPSVAVTMATIVLLRRDDAAWAPGTRAVARQLVFIAFAGFFMSSELAYPLYALVPSLQAVQFPYRFLTISSVASALALALALQPGLEARRLVPAGVALGSVALSVLLSVVFVAKQYREGERPDVAAVLQGDLGTAYSQPATLGTSWKRYVAEGSFSGFCSRAGLRCADGVRKSHHRTWQVEAREDADVLLPLFAFPAWRVSVDGAEVATGIDTATGVIQLRVAPGTHQIEVRWADLWQERVGKAISWGSVVVLIVTLLLERRRSPLAAPSSAPTGPSTT